MIFVYFFLFLESELAKTVFEAITKSFEQEKILNQKNMFPSSCIISKIWSGIRQ